MQIQCTLLSTDKATPSTARVMPLTLTWSVGCAGSVYVCGCEYSDEGEQGFNRWHVSSSGRAELMAAGD